VPELGNELLETLDRAAASDARMDRVPMCANPLVRRLEVKAAVEIKRGAILIELRPNACSVHEDEIDLFGS